jgi:hypothetical protein
MEKSGFFNSSGGDRVYDAVDFAAYFGDLAANGVFYRTTENLRVEAATGMNVTAQPGAAFINGYHYSNDMPLDLPIATANGVNPRIDRVVLRLDNVARAINLHVKTGVAASSPSPPDLTRTVEVYELGIADVTVPKAAQSILPENIADIRLNTALCGLVNSLVSAVYE